ncbi:MAG: hypothetical protein BGO67_06705 [Alphaproteobacteria bacterium 41-28]|nr:MAG: hypothetical protein BGO67_06705 [Alphaproteobacteria bacterium 41-28]
MKEKVNIILGMIVFLGFMPTPSYSQTCVEVFARCRQAYDSFVNGNQRSCDSCKNRCYSAEDICLLLGDHSTFVNARKMSAECRRHCQ